MAAKRPKLASAFNLGGEQAEADPLAELAFHEGVTYSVIESRTDTRCFVVGRTGSGKSAALQHLEENHAEHVIRINPEDLSLPYITDQHVFRYLNSLGVSLDLFWIALWKHLLVVEIIRKRYKVDSVVAKQNFLAGLRARISRDPGKEAALDYLDEFEGSSGARPTSGCGRSPRSSRRIWGSTRRRTQGRRRWAAPRAGARRSRRGPSRRNASNAW